MKTWGDREQPRQGEPCIDLLVSDIEEAARDLRDAGVRILSGPVNAKWGARVTQFSDPDGHILQLTQVDWPRYLAVSPEDERG